MIGAKSKEMWQCDREPRFAASVSTGSNAQEAEFANFGQFPDSGRSCIVQRRPVESPHRPMLRLA